MSHHQEECWQWTFWRPISSSLRTLTSELERLNSMQEDCDLVMYNGTEAHYRSGSTSPTGSNCSGLAMQADANLVVYGGSTTIGNALWASGSLIKGPRARKFSYYLLLQPNGSLDIFDADGGDNVPLPWTKYLTRVGNDFRPPASVATTLDPRRASLSTPSTRSCTWGTFWRMAPCLRPSVDGSLWRCRMTAMYRSFSVFPSILFCWELKRHG